MLDKFLPEIESDATWLVEMLNHGRESQIQKEIQLWTFDWAMAVSDFIEQENGTWKIRSDRTAKDPIG